LSNNGAFLTVYAFANTEELFGELTLWHTG